MVLDWEALALHCIALRCIASPRVGMFCLPIFECI